MSCKFSSWGVAYGFYVQSSIPILWSESTNIEIISAYDFIFHEDPWFECDNWLFHDEIFPVVIKIPNQSSCDSIRSVMMANGGSILWTINTCWRVEAKLAYGGLNFRDQFYFNALFDSSDSDTLSGDWITIDQIVIAGIAHQLRCHAYRREFDSLLDITIGSCLDVMNSRRLHSNERCLAIPVQNWDWKLPSFKFYFVECSILSSIKVNI